MEEERERARHGARILFDRKCFIRFARSTQTFIVIIIEPMRKWKKKIEMHLSSRPIKKQKEQVENVAVLFLTNALDFDNVKENQLARVYHPFRRLSSSLHSIFVCGRRDMYIHIKPHVVSSYIRKSINHIFFRISFHCIKLKLQINIDGEEGEDAALRHHLRACLSSKVFFSSPLVLRCIRLKVKTLGK